MTSYPENQRINKKVKKKRKVNHYTPSSLYFKVSISFFIDGGDFNDENVT